MWDAIAMRPKSPRKLRKPPERGELRAVIDETIALYHRLRWVAEEIYGQEGRSTARRGLLRGLVRYGAQTVPALARARSVTRQHVQEVVDRLEESGLVERIENPRHARSPLIRATRRGEALVQKMDEVDARVLVAAAGAISERDLAITLRTLRSLRSGFELGARWRGAVGARST